MHAVTRRSARGDVPADACRRFNQAMGSAHRRHKGEGKRDASGESLQLENKAPVRALYAERRSGFSHPCHSGSKLREHHSQLAWAHENDAVKFICDASLFEKLARDVPSVSGVTGAVVLYYSCPGLSFRSHVVCCFSTADRLVSACFNGDLPSAESAVADGANVIEKGTVPGWGVKRPPLTAAVSQAHHDVVVWLLSHGADPNGDQVMSWGARQRIAAILQLLIDAGGDVNRKSGGYTPLFLAINNSSEENVRVLLAQPSLDFTVKYGGKTPEQYGRDYGMPVLADMVAEEVSGKSFRFAWGVTGALLVRHGVGVAVAGRGRDEQRWYDH